MDNTPWVLHKDNPFKQQIEKRIHVTTDSDKGIILNEVVTITRERQYIHGSWVKFTQDKELLSDLTPWGWYILGNIALKLAWKQERVHVVCKELGMDRRMFRRTMLELLSKSILVNTRKRDWYWINLTILVMGNINKHESEK